VAGGTEDVGDVPEQATIAPTAPQAAIHKTLRRIRQPPCHHRTTRQPCEEIVKRGGFSGVRLTDIHPEMYGRPY
jgi:hypothetical protein